MVSSDPDWNMWRAIPKYREINLSFYAFHFVLRFRCPLWVKTMSLWLWQKSCEKYWDITTCKGEFGNSICSRLSATNLLLLHKLFWLWRRVIAVKLEWHKMIISTKNGISVLTFQLFMIRLPDFETFLRRITISNWLCFFWIFLSHLFS